MTERIVAGLSVPPEHPVFVGHFPGLPIVPGVMLLDWVLREVATVVGCANGSQLRLRESKFFDPLLPGQRADLSVAIDPGRCKFRILRDGAVLATGLLERRDD